MIISWEIQVFLKDMTGDVTGQNNPVTDVAVEWNSVPQADL